MGEGYFVEDLKEGMEEVLKNQVTEADIIKFAEVTGDTNPVHLDEEYASKTMFKTRIAHGMLSAGYISAVLGTKLPGPGAIYLSQEMRFKAPVRIGDEVVTTCRISKLDSARKRVTFETVCSVGDTVVVEGTAMLMVPSRES